MSQAERVLEHELDESTDVTADLPANLNEEQRALVEMQHVFEMTVEPGVMRLPVKSVSTHDKSHKWAITLEHPITGDITLHVDKPVTGWHEDCELATLLEWYNIHDQDVYKLQCEHIYVEHDESVRDDWKLKAPPWTIEEPTAWEQRRERLSNIRPGRSMETMWTTMWAVTGLVMFAMMFVLTGMTMALLSAGLSMAALVVATIAGVMVLDARGEV